MPRSGLVGKFLGPRSVFTPHLARTGILATRMRWLGARSTWGSPYPCRRRAPPTSVPSSVFWWTGVRHDQMPVQHARRHRLVSTNNRTIRPRTRGQPRHGTANLLCFFKLALLVLTHPIFIPHVPCACMHVCTTYTLLFPVDPIGVVR
jgi:hypothetical protein